MRSIISVEPSYAALRQPDHCREEDIAGRQREETEPAIAFRSHWGFQTEFCNPARGNEKGGVENELGWYRRNFLVPIPEAGDLAGLNALLLEKCRASQQHTISGRTMTIAAAMEQERPHLLPLAAEGFALEDVLYPVVDGKGCVRVKTNWYSTPLDAGVRPMVKVWPTAVEIFRDFECVARHQRCYGRGHPVAQSGALSGRVGKEARRHGGLDSAGAVAGSGRWPECLDAIWRKLETRHGRSGGTRR
jgi:hypothetical protein